MCIDDGLEQNCGISINNALEVTRSCTEYIDDLALDCGNSIANALELPEPCDKSSTYLLVSTKETEYHCYLIAALFQKFLQYRQTFNIRCTLIAKKIVDHSDVVGASTIGVSVCVLY